MIITAIIIGDLLRQWCTTKKTNAELDYEDTDMKDLMLTGLTDVEMTNIEQMDDLPGLCACNECEFCDCDECDPCNEDKDDPVILEELTSRQGGVIIDIRDDPPYLFYARDYDHDQNEYDQPYDNPFDNPWDNTTSNYDSQDSQDSENEEIHNPEFPTIWHELMHALVEQEQSRGLRR